MLSTAYSPCTGSPVKGCVCIPVCYAESKDSRNRKKDVHHAPQGGSESLDLGVERLGIGVGAAVAEVVHDVVHARLDGIHHSPKKAVLKSMGTVAPPAQALACRLRRGITAGENHPQGMRNTGFYRRA